MSLRLQAAGHITEAELHAILVGLDFEAGLVALMKGFSRVIVESDSMVAVNLINDGCPSTHPAHNLVEDIRIALRHLGSFFVVHTLREDNQAADSFAKFGLSLDYCSKFFSNFPAFASLPLRVDLAGIYFPRGF